MNINRVNFTFTKKRERERQKHSGHFLIGTLLAGSSSGNKQNNIFVPRHLSIHKQEAFYCVTVRKPMLEFRNNCNKSSKCVSNKLNHFHGLCRDPCQTLVIPGNMKVLLLSRWPSLALLGFRRRIKSRFYYCFYVALRRISDLTMTPRRHLSSGGKKKHFFTKVL